MMDMMQDPTTRSLAAVSALMAFRQTSVYSEPHECNSTPVLDLCVRPRKNSLDLEGAKYHEDHYGHNLSTTASSNNNNNNNNEDTTPTTTTSQYMMSTTTSSDSAFNHDSDSSMSSDNSRESKIRSSMAVNFAAPFNARLKPTRPFKAFPNDPLSMSLGMSSSADSSVEAYREFRRQMLEHMGRRNDGITNKNMRRMSLPANGCEDPAKNAAYWEKRKKNNEAAKRSRDARRAKEDEIAIRAAYLEHENLKLKYELAALKEETVRLRAIAFPKK